MVARTCQYFHILLEIDFAVRLLAAFQVKFGFECEFGRLQRVLSECSITCDKIRGTISNSLVIL